MRTRNRFTIRLTPHSRAPASPPPGKRSTPRGPTPASPRSMPCTPPAAKVSGRVVALVLSVLVIPALAACTGATDDGHEAEMPSPPTVVVGTGTVPRALPFSKDDVPTMNVTAAEDGDRYRLEAPDGIAGGTVGIDFDNGGREPHNLVVMKPKPGVTMAQLIELIGGPAPDAAPTIAQLLGGSSVVPPKSKRSVALHLDPGDYMLVSMHRGRDGRLDAAHGMYKKLVVAAQPEEVSRRAKAPSEGAGVTITDDSFKLPDGFGLSGWYKVTNGGQRPHELVLVKLADGATPDDAKAWLHAVEGGPPPSEAPFSYTGGSSALDPGRSDSVQIDLGAGTFVAFSALANRADGFTPDYDGGLFLTFTRA